MTNFRYFALTYLNMWCEKDSVFINDLGSASRNDRLRGIRNATTYYGINRNFKLINEPDRLGSALTLLEEVQNDITDDNADLIVIKLACDIKKIYGIYAISAASKLLWMKYKTPIVIYDSMAIQSLRNTGAKLKDGEYEAYRSEWRKQFAIHEKSIQSACTELISVKYFSLADDMPDVEFEALVGKDWFHERVFDIYLWMMNGAS